MDCCAHNCGLNRIFDEQTAQSELKSYWKRGLDRHTRALAGAITAQGVREASVLEVGAGIGGLHQELLKNGAARATDVDVSAAYLAAAQTVSGRLGTRGRVDYVQADFARESDSIPPADVVVLHRVVCCYPDMPGLVGAAAGHARRLLALSFPKDTWYWKAAEKVFNLGLWLSRSPFRIYVHPQAGILRAAAAAGLQPVQHRSSWPWHMVLFART